MTIDPIERVALAIEKSMFAPHELPLDAELHGKYRDTAKAAITEYLEAIREPTEEMIRAGEDIFFAIMDYHSLEDIWQAMLDKVPR